MIGCILMTAATVLGIFLIIETKRAEPRAVVEIIICKGWANCFKRQALEEKKEQFLTAYEKYHHIKQKKAAKKIVAWNKEIEAYQNKEKRYLSGNSLSLLDIIPAFGYQTMAELHLDANNSTLRDLTKKCEHSGYIELERKMETNGKANAQIYAKYLLASLISFTALGVVLSCVLVSIAVSLELEPVRILLFGMIAFGGPVLAGYLPYDELQNRANNRQEALDLDFPNALSKMALLSTANLSLPNVVEETARSGDSAMCRELKLVVKEMKQGSTVAEAFSRMQRRCENRFLDRLVSIAAKSYSAGNTNLAENLREINADCWLDKKHNARRMRESIQNKLFIPTILMFVGILVVIVVPAMAGFNL